MSEKKPTSAFGALIPGRKAKLKIWAIRSLIVIVAAYVFVRMGVGAWFIWAAWAYVAATLVLAFVLTRPTSPNGGDDGSGDGSGGGSD